MKIAVYTKNGTELSPFFQSDCITIYTKDGEWNMDRQINVLSPLPQDTQALRKYIRALAESMGDCRVIAGGGMSGLPYNIFGKAGFSVFDITKLSPEILDDIADDVSSATLLADEACRDATGPIESSIPGIFSVNLIKAQSSDPSVSSKKLLQPFLRDTPFFELHMVCSHIPPWLEDGCWDIKQEKTRDGNIKAVLIKKQCKG